MMSRRDTFHERTLHTRNQILSIQRLLEKSKGTSPQGLPSDVAVAMTGHE